MKKKLAVSFNLSVLTVCLRGARLNCFSLRRVQGGIVKCSITFGPPSSGINFALICCC